MKQERNMFSYTSPESGSTVTAAAVAEAVIMGMLSA